MHPLREQSRSLLLGLVRRFVRVEEEEFAALSLSFLYFFLLLSGYYVLQPLRDTLGLAGGVRGLPWLIVAGLGVMLVANFLFSKAVASLPRRRFLPLVYRVSMVCLLAFWGALRFTGEAWLPSLGRAFFLFVGVYNLFIVSVFWGFMADLWRGEQGKRLFGFVGAGGTLGQFAGSALTARLSGVLDPVDLLLLTVVLLELAVRSVQALAQHLEEDAEEAIAVVEARDRSDAFLNGVRRLLASPYLVGICLYLFLYTFTSSFLWLEKMAIVAEAFADHAARIAFFAQVNMVVATLTVVVQLFLTGRLLPWLGLPRALALVPALTALGFVVMGFHPVLAVYVVFEVVRKAANYALGRPAREILYTVVDREEKYQIKSFIDTFVYRGGDVVAAVGFAGLVGMNLGMAVIALTAVPFSLLWMGTGLWLGERQQAMATAAAAVDDESKPDVAP